MSKKKGGGQKKAVGGGRTTELNANDDGALPFSLIARTYPVLCGP